MPEQHVATGAADDAAPAPVTAESQAAGPDHRLTLLIWTVIGAGVLAMLSGLAQASMVETPTTWRLALAAAVLVIGDTALLHVRFGHDQHSFTWSETAIVVGLVLLPSPWLRIVGPAAVAVAHLVARRPLLKVAFNAMSFASGALLARIAFFAVASQLPAEVPTQPGTWLALAAASFAFWLWNGMTVSAAVAFSQNLPFEAVYRKGLLLNALVWLGNTTTGILLVAMAASQASLLLVVPLLFGLLCLAYRSYLRAMQERDVWQVLEGTSRELLRVEQSEVARVVIDRTSSLFGAQFVELLLVENEDDGEARVLRWTGGDELVHLEGRPTELAGTFWGRVLCEREPFTIDIGSAPAAHRRELEAHGLALCLVAPLLAQGRCLGTLRIGFRGAIHFGPRDAQVFHTFANHVSAAVQNTRLFEEMRRQALHDPLTGLPNRTLLLDRLEQAQVRAARGPFSVAVLFLDLDRFKVINDSLGHGVGDQLLVAVAKRLTQGLRPGDTATRFGGDEFVVVCEEVTDERQAMDIADRLAASLAAPFTIGGERIFLTASVGVTIGRTHHEDPDSLLRDADAAMYRAKERGRARCEMFDKEMRARAVARLETEKDLRRALDSGELRLHYQPYVDVAGGRLIGAEALVRWEHPKRGMVMPSEFIPLAEETGLVVPLGNWVLNEACRQLSVWRNEWDACGEPFYVSVNLSPHQLNDPTIVDQVARALAQWDVPPDALCLEITETALLEDVDAAVDVLRRLRGLGVRIALDDFGTGYSALSYLYILPVDVLKIDRSFVGRLGPDPRDRAIVSGMIELAHALDLTVVAEGVESAEQLAQLSALDCNVAQGYYFSTPVPPGALEGELLAMATAADTRWRSATPSGELVGTVVHLDRTA